MEGMMMIAKLQEESDGEEGRKGAPHGGFPAKNSLKQAAKHLSANRRHKRKDTDSVETR